MIGSLLKLAFWGSLVLLVLPLDTGRTNQHQTADINVLDTVFAARGVAEDMRGFCARQPEACAVGSAAFATIKARAQVGAEQVAAYLAERDGMGSHPADAMTTASVNPVPVEGIPVPTARPDF